jgi:hypothetical protein
VHGDRAAAGDVDPLDVLAGADLGAGRAARRSSAAA